MKGNLTRKADIAYLRPMINAGWNGPIEAHCLSNPAHARLSPLELVTTVCVCVGVELEPKRLCSAPIAGCRCHEPRRVCQGGGRGEAVSTERSRRQRRLDCGVTQHSQAHFSGSWTSNTASSAPHSSVSVSERAGPFQHIAPPVKRIVL